MIILTFFIAHWFTSLFCQTFFVHRYASHRMFSMSLGWERFFHLFSYVSQGFSYLNPRAYALLHRMHHAYSDTEKDPHSPHHTENLFTMMWKTKDIYNNFVYNRVQPDPKFDRHYPVWPRLEKIADTWFSRIAWGTFYVLV